MVAGNHGWLYKRAPIGIVLAYLAPMFVNESEKRSGRFDLAGAATSTVGMTALVYGFINAAQHGWAKFGTIGSFVAAGVLSYGIHDLQEAGFLPGLNNLAFDVSDTIPPGTWYATLLKGIFNFSPVTTKLEALAWVLYVVPTLTLFLRSVRRRASAQPPPRVPAPTA